MRNLAVFQFLVWKLHFQGSNVKRYFYILSTLGPIFNPLVRFLPAQLCNDVITLPKGVT